MQWQNSLVKVAIRTERWSGDSVREEIKNGGNKKFWQMSADSPLAHTRWGKPVRAQQQINGVAGCREAGAGASCSIPQRFCLYVPV